MTDEVVRALKGIDSKLSAILTLMLDDMVREAPGVRHRARSIDRILADAGMNGVEIGRALGKSPQAVSQALAKDKKPSSAKKPSASKGGIADGN